MDGLLHEGKYHGEAKVTKEVKIGSLGTGNPRSGIFREQEPESQPCFDADLFRDFGFL